MTSINSHRTLLLGFIGLFFLMLLSPLPAQAAADSKSEEISWFFLVVGLLGGLSLFLYGMEKMSDALKNVAGEKMKDILGMLSNNRFMGMITGAIVTAVIQSSSVTTVMLVGFVTAGLMSLSQTIGVIMGSNIGTTITAQFAAIGGTVPSRRAAMAHSVFNVLGDVIIISFFSVYVQMIEKFVPGDSGFVNYEGNYR